MQLLMRTSGAHKGGYTLVELIVSIGIFALVMVLASGAYLVMIGLNRQAQATASGIDNLSFALESMSRTMRTGSNYSCLGVGSCGSGGSWMTLADAQGNTVRYEFVNSTIQETVGGVTWSLTDPTVRIDTTKSKFYIVGADSVTDTGDVSQPRVLIVIQATIDAGPGKTVTTNVQAEATMRGPDI